MKRTWLPLVLALLGSSVLFGLFALIAWNVQTDGGLACLDAELCSELDTFRQDTPALEAFVRLFTRLGGIWIIVGVVGVALVWPIRARRFDLALAWVAALAGAYLLTEVLKMSFARPRPPLATASGWSFPSGHALNSFVGYGFSVYVVWQTSPPHWVRLFVLLAVSMLIVGIGFSRLYLGEHYLSDVLGSWTLAGGLLAGVVSLFYVRSCKSTRGS